MFGCLIVVLVKLSSYPSTNFFNSIIYHTLYTRWWDHRLIVNTIGYCSVFGLRPKRFFHIGILLKFLQSSVSSNIENRIIYFLIFWYKKKLHKKPQDIEIKVNLHGIFFNILVHDLKWGIFTTVLSWLHDRFRIFPPQLGTFFPFRVYVFLLC